MADIILFILIALALAYFLSEIFRFFRLPRVLGQILAGIILGLPMLKNMLLTEDVLSKFSFIPSIGIILLFFFIGLEINLRQFKKNFKETSLIAFFNTLIPLTIGFIAGKFLFGLNNITSLIIGISVSVSSQAISLDLLEELRLLKSKISNLIISSGAVDDVFELLLISFILVIFHSTAFGPLSYQKLIFDILVFVFAVIIFKLIIIPFALKVFEKENSRSALFMGTLVIVLLMAYISEILGIGSLIGALIAGMLVRHTLLTGEERKPWRKNEISHLIHVVSFGFLIPLFFVSVGINMNLNTLSSNLFLVFILLTIDILGTLIGTIIGVLLSKGTFAEGLIVGFGVIPKGDTELVIATLALNSGLISVDIFTAIIAVAVISTFLAPVIFNLLIQKFHHKFFANQKLAKNSQ
ncbi:cation:proton antiporter [Candidatus Woesearchaeota archaeon]|nr:cation:proton antiporter [Candidatus Woesearchaeota archaeon]